MKPSAHSSSFFYRVKTDPKGHHTLEEITFEKFSSEIAETLESIVCDFVKKDDLNLLDRIAAGTAAQRIFEQRVYRGWGLTKEGFCKGKWGRSSRTVRSYVAAATSFEAIGGLGCPVQPTSIDQLDAIARLRPQNRKDFWLKLGTENNGAPPSGAVLERRAEDENLLIPKRKSKKKPSKAKDLPCSNHEEATAFAEAHAKQEPKGPWTKMHVYLLSLTKQTGQSVLEPKAKTTKPKPIRDARGQTLMFEEVFQPVTASVVDQLEIPTIG